MFTKSLKFLMENNSSTAVDLLQMGITIIGCDISVRKQLAVLGNIRL